ncbi:MAG: hypothetical protein LBD02_03870 [Christensenellaceae bacterium]|jgi:hypothetical protein|nr:hypothetical protein [Christensenellaceae bacterium]
MMKKNGLIALAMLVVCLVLLASGGAEAGGSNPWYPGFTEGSAVWVDWPGGISGYLARTTALALHFRSGPGTSHPIITKLPRGSEVVLVSSEGGRWVYAYAQVGGFWQPGYLYNKYLEGPNSGQDDFYQNPLPTADDYGYAWSSEEKRIWYDVDAMTAPPIFRPISTVESWVIGGRPQSTPEPTTQPTPEPTSSPTPEPTATPTPEPTATPTPEPTATPAPAERIVYMEDIGISTSSPNFDLVKAAWEALLADGAETGTIRIMRREEATIEAIWMGGKLEIPAGMTLALPDEVEIHLLTVQVAGEGSLVVGNKIFSVGDDHDIAKTISIKAGKDSTIEFWNNKYKIGKGQYAYGGSTIQEDMALGEGTTITIHTQDVATGDLVSPNLLIELDGDATMSNSGLSQDLGAVWDPVKSTTITQVTMKSGTLTLTNADDKLKNMIVLEAGSELHIGNSDMTQTKIDALLAEISLTGDTSKKIRVSGDAPVIKVWSTSLNQYVDWP